MPVISELNALDQPFGKPLLRDGFKLVSSAIGNEELDSALLPNLPLVLRRYSFSTRWSHSLRSALSS